MTKKLALLFLALIMIFALAACAAPDEPADTDAVISGSGTEEDPWLCGATKDDDVRVFVTESGLYVNGDGKMMDFENPADRPWNDMINDAEDISVFDAMEYIGRNAFKDAGLNCDYVNIFLGEGIKNIGDSAFENAKIAFDDGEFCFDGIVTIPESVETIGSRAFAGSNVNMIYFDGVPQIADDAFEGVEGTAYFRNNSGWDDANKLSYGGELTYKTLYAFSYIDDYGTDEMSGEGTVYVPEDENLYYNANDYVDDENYGFMRYEVLSGDLTVDDPANPELNIALTGDVQVKIIYAKVVE